MSSFFNGYSFGSMNEDVFGESVDDELAELDSYGAEPALLPGAGDDAPFVLYKNQDNGPVGACFSTVDLSWIDYKVLGETIDFPVDDIARNFQHTPGVENWMDLSVPQRYVLMDRALWRAAMPTADTYDILATYAMTVKANLRAIYSKMKTEGVFSTVGVFQDAAAKHYGAPPVSWAEFYKAPVQWTKKAAGATWRASKGVVMTPANVAVSILYLSYDMDIEEVIRAALGNEQIANPGAAALYYLHVAAQGAEEYAPNFMKSYVKTYADPYAWIEPELTKLYQNGTIIPNRSSTAPAPSAPSDYQLPESPVEVPTKKSARGGGAATMVLGLGLGAMIVSALTKRR